MKKLISLVIPIYNEEAVLERNLSSILMKASNDEEYSLELIAIDDGSNDKSAIALQNLSRNDPRVRTVVFTRNFGKEAAILAGLTEAKGDAVIVLDSDLQHPPELIPKMIDIWNQGVYVVEAVKYDRGNESIGQKLSAQGFYYLFEKFANLKLKGQSDYKLLDRKVVDAYVNLPEKNHFFRGLVSWAGYPAAQIPFAVAPRDDEGGTKWSKLKLIKYAIANITSFSSLPLKLISYIGVITMVLGFIAGTITLLKKFYGYSVDGFTTVNLLIIMTSGAIMLSLGIIGHYLARIYDEIKGRPVYLIKPESLENE